MVFLPSLSRSLGSLSHLPTWFFIIGYPLFWIEMYVFKAPQGTTSSIGWLLFLGVALLVGLSSLASFKEGGRLLVQWWSSLVFIEKCLWVLGLILTGISFAVIVLAGVQPIHLMQESDCMNYHYTLPRQHLILDSFAHIPWAADDLFLLPIDFALSVFWFATLLPNKLPQLVISVGLIAVVIRLMSALPAFRLSAVFLFVFAFLGCLGISFQLGTGMLDLVVAYLFFAALDSLRQGRWCLAAVEFTFFFWSKPLMPVQVICLVVLVGSSVYLLKFFKWQLLKEFTLLYWRKALVVFLLLSVVVAGPFVVKSIYYAGTPLYPLSPGMVGKGMIEQSNPFSWVSLEKASQHWMQVVKDDYGHGRTIEAWIKHWWLLAVPERGINNSFDYPLGLSYLLLIGPFLFFLFKDIVKKTVSIGSLVAICYWMLWWFSSQQARFLYIPLLIMFALVLLRYIKVPKVLVLCLTAAVALQAIFLWQMHQRDILSSSVITVLRDQDRQLIGMSSDYIGGSLTGFVDYPSHEAAYAQFPVRVKQEKLPHTIAF